MGKMYREDKDFLGRTVYKDVSDESVDTADTIEFFMWLLKYGVPLVLNVSIAYLWAGGSLSDFLNDTWVNFLKSHFPRFVIYLIIFTGVSALITSYASDFIDALLPSIAGIIGAVWTGFLLNNKFNVLNIIKGINDTGSLIIGGIAIILSLIAVAFGGVIAFSVIETYETLGYWIRKKADDISYKFKGKN